MRIIDVQASVFEESVLPSICFEVTLGHTKFQEAIMSVGGWLKSDEGKTVSNLFEERPETSEQEEIGARGTSHDNKFREESYRTVLKTFLKKQELDYLEKRRMADRKGDVVLTMVLHVKIMVSHATVFHTFTVPINQTDLQRLPINTSRGRQTGEIIAYTHDPQFSSSQTNRWVISGNGKPVFLSVMEQILSRKIIIASSDWIHDYSPKFGLGEYYIVEISKGKKTIKKAWEYIEKADESYQRWDTKSVYVHCREAGSHLDGVISKKFGKRSFAYKERWGRTYQRFENLASLDLHVEDISKSQQYKPEEISVGKEDAEHLLFSTKLLVKYAEQLV